MSVATMRRTAERIAEHVLTHRLAKVFLVLHGGEPLLAGPERLRELVTELRAPLDPICDVDIGIQTNGVLLTSRFCDLFRELGIKVGISLDGDRTANDLHRLYRDGRSSYDQVIHAIDLLRTGYPDIYCGLLCTIDITNDPIAVYDALISHRPPGIDFLWPHHTWEHPPPRTSETAYADWLGAIADKWLADGRPVPVRMFDSIISTTQGGSSFTESLGLEASDLIVIETDGSYEQVDSLKTAFHGAADTGMDVFRHSIDEVGRHPGILARQGGLTGLCATCRRCPVVATCGGGLFAHRYRPGEAGASAFANPSVYCKDLLAVIDHIQQRTVDLSGALPATTLRSFAAGHGDSLAMCQLKSTQGVGRRALLATIGAKSAPSRAWELLEQISEGQPDALDAVLGHPYIRVWGLERLRRLNAGEKRDDGLLATVACVAAARAGIRATLEVPVRADAIYLPAIGTYTVPGRASTTVEIDDAGGLDVAGTACVQRIRYLTAGTFTVALDDLDPFRDRHEWPAAARLDDDAFAAWQDSFEGAWALLRKQYGEYAPAIADGLTTIVPLDSPDPGRSVSSAARDAFGSVGIALPDSPDTLCLLLLHEFQHVKLGAILDFIDLYDVTDNRAYHAPWREDPRPLEGLLQGTYAHIAVADFWRRQSWRAETSTAAEASRQFDDWYPKTLTAVETLEESGSLTGVGQRFVAQMRATLESWRDEESAKPPWPEHPHGTPV